MSNQYILVLPNFAERPAPSTDGENNCTLITQDEGLTEVQAAALVIGTHDFIVNNLKCQINDTTDEKGMLIENEMVIKYALRDDLADFDEYDLTELALELSQSNTPTMRGNRTVLIDVDNNAIYVGTAIVYNPRRATVGVVDDSIPNMILNF